MTEDELLTGLVEALRLTGWRLMHLGGDQRGMYRGDPGWPDLFAISSDHKRALAWECKDDRGQLSEGQWWWLLALGSAVDRLDVRVVRPADYDAALRYIVAGTPMGEATRT
jgi:hypothetical protein